MSGARERRGWSARRVLLALLVLLVPVASGCAAPRPRPSVALVVVGQSAKHAKDVEVAATRADVGVDFRVAKAPTVAQGPTDPPVRLGASDVELALSTARADYVSGELGRVRSCAERLGDPDLVWSSLSRRARAVASRVMVWRIACTSIARRDEAVDAARAFASLGLELPADVDAIPVEAHKILTSALRAAETSPKRALTVTTTPPGAGVLVDGRAACTSPCAVDVAVGDHLVAVEKNGSAPSARVVRVDGKASSADASFRLETASPETAAAQWAQSYGATRGRSDDGDALALLAQAARARKLVYLDAEPLGSGTRIRGALVVDGRVDARDEQRGAPTAASREVVEELLVKGGVVESSSVFRKPLFWVAVVAGAAASAGLTAYVLYDPGSRTEVRTR